MPKTACKAISGAVDLTVAKLSLPQSLWLQSSLAARLHWATSLQPFPQREKLLRPDGGALKSEEMGPFCVKLLLFSHFWYFYMWSLRLCDFIKSNHICLVEIHNQVFVATDLVRTVMGMALKDFSFMELSFWSPGWLLFCIHLSP